MSILLALVGFAPTETQARYPPALAWLGLCVAAYGTAWIVESISRLMPVLSVYFRTLGVVAVALVAQGIVRSIFFRDGLSWSGWIRELVTRP